MTVTKQLLSASINGRQIKVAATSTPGTLIHTATATSGELDEVWIYATNQHASTIQLTLEWGGVASPDDTMTISIPYKSGRYLVIDGKILRGGLEVRAFASVTNLIMIDGFVNRIAP